MAITLGTPTNSGNNTNTSKITMTHTTVANTKALVVVITNCEGSNLGCLPAGVKYNDIDLQYLKHYRPSYAYIVAVYWMQNPPVGTFSLTVATQASVVDLQATAIGLFSSTASAIAHYATSDGTTVNAITHTVTMSSLPAGSIGIGGIVDLHSRVTDLSVTTGTEIAGSEADMGNQVVGCAYKFESGGSISITWTKTSAALSFAMFSVFYEQNFPSVDLNTPINADSVSSSTPSLYFTGTDAENNSLHYQVQVSTSNSFNDGIEIQKLTKMEVVHGVWSGPWSVGGSPVNQPAMGQSFSPIAGTLRSVKWYFNSFTAGEGTVNVSMKIYPLSGTYNAGAIPTGTALAVSDPVAISSSTPQGIIEFPFSGANKIILSSSSRYYMVLEFAGPGYMAFFEDSVSDYGDFAYKGNSWTVVSRYRLLFEVLVEVTGSSISVYSQSDPGFLPISGPYSSGASVNYTLQNSISAGITYYWRVRSIDPTGSHLWGSWSEIRTFTLSAGSSLIQAVDALAKASIANFNGLAMASVAKIDGLT